MAIIRRFPYPTHFGIEQQLQDIQRRMSALNPPGTTVESRPRGSFQPSMDVYRDDDELVVEFELPGIDVDNDVDVSVHDGTLTVRGSRTSERSEEQDGVYLTERRSGSFSRSMALPDGVDADSVRADYDDGVLCIRMPMPDASERSHEPRKISIGQGSGKSTAKKAPARKAPAKKAASKKSGGKESESDSGDG